MSLFTIVALAGAAEPTHAPIQAALDEGRIDAGEALWLGYLAHFEPSTLDEDWRSDQLPWHCATEFVATLKADFELLTAEQQEHVSATLEPFKQRFDDPLPIQHAAPPPSGSDTCWGQYADNRILGDHFSVEWDEGRITEQQAANFLEYLEHGWDVEVDDLGWNAPAGSDDYLIMAYVNQGGAGAYTTVSRCGGDEIPYIVAGNGSFSSGNWWQDMAVHEFKHAVQFSYGWATEFWWWEASATYIQEYVNPENNWWSSYISGYTQNPQIALNAYSQSDYDVFYHMYGMAIWAFYLDEHVGGHELVQATWDYADDQGGLYSVGMDETLEALGHDFREVFAGFLANNTVMDFEDQRYFGSVAQQATHKSLPVQGSSTSKTEPEALGANYIQFKVKDVDPEKPDLLWPSKATRAETGSSSWSGWWTVSW